MRSKILPLLLILAVTGAMAADAVAQNLVPAPAIGLKAGLNSSRWQVAGSGTSNRSGGVAGAFVRAPLGSIAMQAELLWSRKGFNKSSYGTYTDVEVQTDNWEIPVAVVIDIPSGGVDIYVLAGISFGIVTGVQQKHAESDDWEDADDVLSDTNTMAIFGTGIRYDKVGLEFRWNHGMTNLAASDVDADIYDRGWSITASYAIWN